MEAQPLNISVSLDMLVLKLMKGRCLERTSFLLSLEADGFYVELDRQQQFRSIQNLYKGMNTSLVRKVELKREFRAPEEIDSIF